LFVATPHGHGLCKILSTLPSVKKKLCPQLFTTNIGDKQFPWYPILIVQKIEHAAFQ
jgi:hypothetical protein